MSVLVGRSAPEFVESAVWPDNDFRPFRLADYRGRYVVLFFYPLDFTYVCPSELIAFEHRMAAFSRRQVDVAGCSIDSTFSHLAWKKTPREEGGIGQLSYPLIGDVTHSVCRAFDVEGPTSVALRATFLIDRDGIVQHQIVNSLAIGRDIDELLRVIDALQYTERNGEVCPAGWQKGKVGVMPTDCGVAQYLAEHSDML
ncbi:MAG: peroxidase [Methyloversatilis sp. 12-65-5]|nr:MAG: peroxidase [Methyloversatilis sp. 12-65-5]